MFRGERRLISPLPILRKRKGVTMSSNGGKRPISKGQEYHLRKLVRSGNSRYVSVSTILPKDWEAVKVYVDSLSSDSCVLRIIPIR